MAAATISGNFLKDTLKKVSSSSVLCVLFHQGLPGPAGLKGEGGDHGPQVRRTLETMSPLSLSGTEGSTVVGPGWSQSDLCLHRVPGASKVLKGNLAKLARG